MDTAQGKNQVGENLLGVFSSLLFLEKHSKASSVPCLSEDDAQGKCH